jgi:thiopeptide-type bacteriocin biosynthesis protein
MVSVDKEEIVLRSKKLNKRIIPRLSNAHNFYKSENAAYRFLCSVQSQNQKNINFAIEYSKLRKRFFPRIAYKNIILHRACWILHEDDLHNIKKAASPITALKEFFQQWKVTQFVVLVQGDNELFLDTTHESYLQLLLEELKSSTMIQLAEWLQHANDGNYSQQIVLPLENKSFNNETKTPQYSSSSVQRSFAPGSEWLYLKLYCSSSISDALLRDVIKPVLDQLAEDKIVQSSFFIRYMDPHHHIRIRLKLKNKNHYSEAIRQLHETLDPYFQEESIWNIQADSYHREIERYGAAYMEATEAMFGYDSQLILTLLNDETFAASEEIRLFSAVKNIDRWLSLFNFSLHGKLEFCQSVEKVFLKEFDPELNAHITSKYRILKDDLYSFITSPDFEKEFEERDENISHLTLDKNNLSSYIHMSLNRWFPSEQRALELMTYSFAVKYYNRILNQSR